MIALLATILITLSSADCHHRTGTYTTMEEMCWVNSAGARKCYGPPKTWFHEKTLVIKQDSLYIRSVPVVMENGEKLYSASDGGFMYYTGTVHCDKKGLIARYAIRRCEYCGLKTRKDPATGWVSPVMDIDTVPLVIRSKGLRLGDESYELISTDTAIDSPEMFEFDSTGIYRENPKGQYAFIRAGIEDFLEENAGFFTEESVYLLRERMGSNGRPIEILAVDSLIGLKTYVHHQVIAAVDTTKLTKISGVTIRMIWAGKTVEYPHEYDIDICTSAYRDRKRIEHGCKTVSLR